MPVVQPFDDYMEAALYHPAHGFYTARGGVAGRRGDFITSVEVGPLFGAVVGRWLDACWEELGRPAPFRVADVGAGPGTLARSLRTAGSACRAALDVTSVELSAQGRARHDPATTRSVETLLEAGPQHVVVANELLDNLPVRIWESTGDAWLELWVGSAGEELRPVRPVPAEVAAAIPAAQPAGTRVPVAVAAAQWVRDVLSRLLPGGRLLVFDYGAETAVLARRPSSGWLRTYRDQQPGGDPLEDPGTQDITYDVPVDQLMPPWSMHVQAVWLHRWGVEDLVDEGRRIWAERAALGDLTALRARSRVREAEALCAPEGLGAFRVLEWRVAGG